ncbi:MAG: hypothetical protein ACRCYQ_08045 [Nocardioides sp.]
MGESASVELYWLPVGAGNRWVSWNGRAFEIVTAGWQRRPARDLYHSALAIRIGADSYVIEMAPVWSGGPGGHGAVARGPVGLRWLGRYALFSYEVRRWPGGTIPDRDAAVASPVAVGGDPEAARRLIELVPRVPTATWGRDELRLGEMWNSNSLISWLIARSGQDPSSLRPPDHGRAPGWNAGITLAARQATAPA